MLKRQRDEAGLTHEGSLSLAERREVEGYGMDLSRSYLELRRSGPQLLDRHVLLEILSTMSTYLATDNMAVIGSIFSKYYSKMAAAGGCYLATMLHVRADLSLDQIEWSSTTPVWDQYKLHVNPSPFQRIKEGPGEFITQEHIEHWTRLFREHLTPLYSMLAEVTNGRSALFWANTAFNLSYYFRAWEQSAKTEEQSARIRLHYQYLTGEAKGELFGLPENPLSIHFRSMPHPVRPEETFYVRSLCCLRYQLPDTGCCTTCPRLGDDERTEAILAYEGASTS